MAKIIVSSWESEGHGHFTHTQQEITFQERKIREICDQFNIDCPEVDTQITSLSTRTQIIAEESVLTQVASYQKVPLLKYKILLFGIYQYLKMGFLYQYDTVYGH